ncbi:PP2C family protein-serine/threonine phosphatase [Paenibacillus konkukensis]|nr:SpoIIE family protein phosphatase [Paenibacillus konkukensis]
MIQTDATNVCLALAFLFVFAKWWLRPPLSPDSPVLTRLGAGLLFGTIGALLLYFVPLASPGTGESLRWSLCGLAVALSAAFGGMLSASVAAVILAERLGGACPDAPIVLSLSPLLVALICGLASRLPWSRSARFHLTNLLQTLAYAALPALSATSGAAQQWLLNGRNAAVSLAGGSIAFWAIDHWMKLQGFRALAETSRAALDQVREVVYLTDREDRWVFLNPAWSDMTGFPAEAALQTSVLNYIHPEDRDEVRSQMNLIRSGALSSCRMEMKVVTQDGGYRWVELYAELVKKGQGPSGGMFGTLTDITERKLSEQQRRYDMGLSKRIQQSVLPVPAENSFIAVKGMHIPSAQVSGDMYTWVFVDRHTVVLLLMDVMGHGVSSSLVSMYMHSYVQSLPFGTSEPEAIIRRLNGRMCELFPSEAGKGGVYCTAVCLRADALNRRVEYVNAGHPYGVMLADDADMTELRRGGIPLGIDAEARFGQGVADYARKARIVLFTDGLFELYRASPAETSARIERRLRACAGEDADCFMRELEEELRKTECKPDDICVVVLDLKEQPMRADKE